MRKLKAGFGRAAGFDARSSLGDDRRVLPRPLRYSMRYFARALKSSRPLPAGMGSALAIGFVALSVGYGVYTGGHSIAMVSSAATTAGFRVEAIQISGQVETSEADVLEALGLGVEKTLLGLDLRQARKRLNALDWIEDVSIRKLFPDRLDITLSEKQPFALWQQDRQLMVIETNGNIITRLGGAELLSSGQAVLPRIIGRGADKSAAKLFDLVSGFPTIFTRVASYVRVADRRWNIMLRNNLVIQLPETGERLALSSVVRLDRERQLLSRQIENIDMRLADRMVIRLMPEAAAARRKLVKQRSKRMRQAEKSI